jgi:hypothetical protein
MPPLDPALFPLREGVTVPRDMVEPHAAALHRTYGTSLETLAKYGGISIYELLVLLPPTGGQDPGAHRRRIFELTLKQAMGELTRARTEWQAKREADAEAAMLFSWAAVASRLPPF